MNKVALNFISYPPPKKIVFYRYIIIQMSNNTSFPLPNVPLIELASGVEAFEFAYLNAEEEGQQANLLSQQEQAIDKLFKMQAGYVEQIANGQKKIIISSGFHPEPIESF